jgi:hypothetical protein
MVETTGSIDPLLYFYRRVDELIIDELIKGKIDSTPQITTPHITPKIVLLRIVSSLNNDVLQYITSNKVFTVNMVSEATGKPTSTTSYIVKQLRGIGFIKEVGRISRKEGNRPIVYATSEATQDKIDNMLRSEPEADDWETKLLAHFGAKRIDGPITRSDIVDDYRKHHAKFNKEAVRRVCRKLEEMGWKVYY